MRNAHLLLVLVGLVAGLVLAQLAGSPPPPPALGAQDSDVAPAAFARRTPVVAAVERAGPAVANVSTERVVVRRDPFLDLGDPLMDEFYGRFFGRRRERAFTTSSLGSAVLVDGAGYAITNAHVVHRASEIHITLADGAAYTAELVGTSVESDLAVLHIAADRALPALRFGSSEGLLIGETVVALGNPFGLENTVTTGVLSARNRSIQERGRTVFTDLLQTDCAINPGNSGGALLNVNAELGGINTAIVKDATGIGFAIPADRVQRVLGEILAPEVLNGTWLGLETAQAVEGGARVESVAKDSPAAEAGVKAGEVVTSVDGRPVGGPFDLQRAILRASAGDTLGLGLGGTAAAPARTVPVKVAARPRARGEAEAERRMGVSLVERRGVGLVVRRVEEGGPGAAVGLTPGDVLEKLGLRRPTLYGSVVRMVAVEGLEGLSSILDGLPAGEAVVVAVNREGEELTGEIRLR
ncbi:MAG: trypsin-like peptidase domain-containing protein [Planctomycetes bacterium]|nr:trypsin-like peptidase domain-containing protein [Planctomycetota bacterium]